MPLSLRHCCCLPTAPPTLLLSSPNPLHHADTDFRPAHPLTVRHSRRRASPQTRHAAILLPSSHTRICHSHEAPPPPVTLRTASLSLFPDHAAAAAAAATAATAAVSAPAPGTHSHSPAFPARSHLQLAAVVQQVLLLKDVALLHRQQVLQLILQRGGGGWESGQVSWRVRSGADKGVWCGVVLVVALPGYSAVCHRPLQVGTCATVGCGCAVRGEAACGALPQLYQCCGPHRDWPGGAAPRRHCGACHAGGSAPTACCFAPVLFAAVAASAAAQLNARNGIARAPDLPFRPQPLQLLVLSWPIPTPGRPPPSRCRPAQNHKLLGSESMLQLDRRRCCSPNCCLLAVAVATADVCDAHPNQQPSVQLQRSFGTCAPMSPLAAHVLWSCGSVTPRPGAPPQPPCPHPRKVCLSPAACAYATRDPLPPRVGTKHGWESSCHPAV